MKEPRYDKKGFEIIGLAAINNHKEADKETEKRLKKNGSLSDYQREVKKNPPERFKEEELHLDFYRILS